MNQNLERFLNSINFVDENNAFINASVNKVIYNRSSESYLVHISNDTIIPLNDCLALLKASENKINGVDKCSITFSYKEIDDENTLLYVKYLLNKLGTKKVSLVSLIDAYITIEDKTIIIEVISKAEEDKIKKEIKKMLSDLENFGITGYDITSVVNESKRLNVIEALKQNEEEKVVVKKDDLILGKKIKKENVITLINDITEEKRNVTSEIYVFGIDTLERENINIITLKISDKTSSILAKIFKKEHSEFETIIKEIKVGNWYKIEGNIEFDNYSHDLVFQIRNMEHISSKDNTISDDCEEKRVELHAHTMMSTMDSVVGLDLTKHTIDLVDFALKLGHRAVAITDHNGCQAFPIAYQTMKKLNKNKELPDHFKVLFGTELNVINDDVDIVFNHESGNYHLLEDEFVIFDTETTGFYVGNDQMIEIGAVKMKNGEVIASFDELINPNRLLPKKITELTNITDLMLKDKDNEEMVTKRFLEFIGNDPLVAHNAKFDIGFIKNACNKYNLGEFTNTVCDTMSMARMLSPEWSNHKLSTLVKKYNVEWDETEHHRADYDALGTARCFYKMAKILNDRNIETTNDIVNEVNVDDLIKFSVPFHMCVIAKNKTGLKNLFKIISAANTTYLFRGDQPKLPRKELAKHREGLLFGSGCINGEIFEAAKTKDDEELSNMMRFYDYIEVQPPRAFKHLLQMESSGFKSEYEIEQHINKIIRVAKSAGKLVVASGDVHHLRPEDKVYREIIVRQKTNGKLHPLNRPGLELPDMSFLTTQEMLDEFSFLEPELRKEIVITNTNKIADMVSEFEVIIDTGGTPFSPKIDKSVETVTELVYQKATSWYGDPLPYLIEERIAKELYGDCVYNAHKNIIDKENNNLPKEEFDKLIYERIHMTCLNGFDAVKQLVCNDIRTINPTYSDEEVNKQLKKELGGIIGGGFDVIYLIAQKLVKKSNEDGFLVGSRGSVGSSFVATMMGITEVNALPAHYRCKNCQHSIFNEEDGTVLGSIYPCGFDLPDRYCPKCGEKMYKDGQDMPFATFLGFNADKVPDIDLNFSDLNQASTHEYTKVLFGIDNVYRAGTIGTVAEKTAFGFVKGYLEDKNMTMRNTEIERIASGCVGVKRTTGQHPGGIVVIPDYMDVYDFTPFQFPAEDVSANWRTTHFDYHSIEEDVLKLDILGHTDPTQLRMLQDLTGIDVTTVPLDDKDTMSIFLNPKALGVTKEQICNETGTLGVPEFGTNFTISMLTETKPKTFAELIKISGLSHGTDVWIGNARDLIINNIVPFSEVIGCRDDIMVYLMYKNVPPLKAFLIMEFVRKGKASKDPITWQTHKQTMQEAGIEEWFIDSCEKIKYMFPKAHAAAYVMSAFRIAYFKVHYPVEYYASYFSTRFDDFDLETMISGYDAIKQKMNEIQMKGYSATNKESSLLETLKLALEATARGFKFSNIDIEKSDGKNFIIASDKKTLIMPFRTLDGLGESVATKIIEERNIKPFYSIEDFQMRGKVNTTTIEKLRMLKVFGNLPESSQLSLF